MPMLSACSSEKPVYNVGILHSLTGTMAVSESPVVLATQMAIEEINAQGGLLGRQIQPIIYDGQSDENVFYRFANKLIREQNVSVVFGCWTSACRKTVKPLFETNNSLLVYPVHFEGLEQSKNILYVGATASQQVVPAMTWAREEFGQRVLMVGSDYVYPRLTHEIVHDQIELLGDEIVDELFYPLGDQTLSGLKERIVTSKPDFILSTLNGSSNFKFIEIMNELSIYPVLATSISEEEFTGATPQFPMYVTNSYFESLPGTKNAQFVDAYRAYAGKDVIVSAAVEAAYNGVKLWAQAVKSANSFQIDDVKNVLPLLSIEGAVDSLYVDINGQLTWHKYYIAKFNNNGKLQLVKEGSDLLLPSSYPITRTKQEWNLFVDQLYQQWRNRWEATPVIEVQQ